VLPKRTRAKKAFTTTKTHKYYCLWLVASRENGNVVIDVDDFIAWLKEHADITISRPAMYAHRRRMIEEGRLYFTSKGEAKLRRL